MHNDTYEKYAIPLSHTYTRTLFITYFQKALGSPLKWITPKWAAKIEPRPWYHFVMPKNLISILY